MPAHREGWLADEYVRLYASSARGDIVSLYGFKEFLPGYELYGSWGLDALCLGCDARFYRIPWIPLSEPHRQEAYSSLMELDQALATLHVATPAYEHFGKEIHFTTPIVFGGASDDDANIVMVDQATHAQLCRYWNRLYAQLHGGAAIPQTAKLQKALWENAARAARRESIATLSGILGPAISPEDFISLDDFRARLQPVQTPVLREELFPESGRDAVLTRLLEVAGLGTPSPALLWFARSEALGALRVSRTPTAEVVLDLLDWDQSTVRVYDASDNLLVGVDRDEDCLEPDTFFQMLYGVTTPKT